MKKVLFILIIATFALNLRAQDIETTNYPEEDKIYTDVDVMPEFKGGMDKFYARLERIPYTFFDRINNHHGQVIVIMIIEKDGSLSNIKVVHGFSDQQDKEILRKVRSLHKWKPGMRNGKPVRVLCSIPINFELLKSS
jgi:protein TonB